MTASDSPTLEDLQAEIRAFKAQVASLQQELSEATNCAQECRLQGTIEAAQAARAAKIRQERRAASLRRLAEDAGGLS